ncbi:aldose 1-epimerase [Candidatus Symbiothrix dinenymphae]|nr:aldose 1-epimerase [Candidatus Symbiothrix dinenymphae]
MKAVDFEKTVDGKPVRLYTLSNAGGVKMEVTNWGGKIVSLHVPDKNGNLVDVVLGKSNIDDYMDDNEPYFGAICGRVANRIANGKFTLEGKDYTLAVNNGPNALHGGIKGFNSVVWDAKQLAEESLELTYLAKDGEEGYPGNLKVTVIYHLSRKTNALEIYYTATTDQTTILNLTNHSYFNLSGEGDPYVGDHTLQIDADTYLPTNDTAIPLGNLEKVEGTPFDFRSPHTIGERIGDDNQQLIWGVGYDHTYIVNRPKLNKADDALFVAKAYSPKTGITMVVYSTEPGVQLYTGNWLNGSFVGKNGHTYPKRSAFCLETQHYPDSIHQPTYPTTVLKAGEKFESKTAFLFKCG